MEHSDLVKRESEGKLMVGIDRAFARKFYTDHSIRDIAELTGESPYLEKLIVNMCLFGGPIALIMAGGFAIRLFEWWAVLAIPGLGAFWVMTYALSSRGNSGVGLLSTMLAGSIFGLWFKPVLSDYVPLTTTFLASLWLTRMLYVCSGFFLRAFVIRNRRAFDHLADRILIREL